MTFNIHHGKGMDGGTDLPRIAAEIRRANVDVVALQEVDCYMPRSGFRNQIAELAKELDMYGVYSPSLNFKFSRYGNALLSKEVFTDINIYYMKGLLERRSILMANTEIEGQRVRLVNTHLGVFSREHKPQMGSLTKTLAKLRQPAILMGDFNLEQNNPVFAQLAPVWRPIPLIHEHSTMWDGTRIDHMMVNRLVSNARAWVHETAASDHHAIVAELHDLV